MQVHVAPPEDVDLRKRIEKLAAYVVKNGDGFEQKVKDKEAHNPQWAFLRDEDKAAAAYYRMMLDIKRIQNPVAPPLNCPDPEDVEKRAYIDSLKRQREAKRKQKQPADQEHQTEQRPKKKIRVEVEHYYVHICRSGERVMVQDLADAETDPSKRKATSVEYDLDDRNWPAD
jgi:hypothetical protein